MGPDALPRASHEQPMDLYNPLSDVDTPHTPPVKDQVEQFERGIPFASAYEAPEDGWGWVCVGACFAVNAFTWGVVAVCIPFRSVVLAIIRLALSSVFSLLLPHVRSPLSSSR